MKFSILTIFPDLFTGFFRHGIVRRALDLGLIDAKIVNIRDHATGRHRVTDDRPFGGGDGMVMKPEPLAAAIRAVAGNREKTEIIYLTPQGVGFDQNIAAEISAFDHAVLICGRYEGVDERICETMVDRELSIGDYVLSGGEIPAMVVIDTVTRLLPGALGGEHSADTDSFAGPRLAHAQYTRPRVHEGQAVPEVLLSGNHRKIDYWRTESALIRTCLKRPDLLDGRRLNEKERRILKKWQRQIETIIAKSEAERS